VKLADISRKKKKEYLKAKIEELESYIKIKNVGDLYRGINDFKKGSQPKTYSKGRVGWFGYRLPQYFG